MRKAKRAPAFPLSAERDAGRVAGKYMKVLSDEILNSLEDIEKLSRKKYRIDSKDYREDGIFETIESIFGMVSKNVIGNLKKIGLDFLMQKIANKVKRKSLSEWANILQEIAGQQADKEDYADEKYEDILRSWEEENSAMAQELIDMTIEKMKEAVRDGVEKHKTPKEIAEELQRIIKKETRHAKQMSMDGVSRLNTELEKTNCKIAGCRRYMWMTKKDGRVRESHAELHGKIFFWDDPPEMWHMLNGAKVMDGRYCHPGEDYRCRCIAIPIFDNYK